MSKEKVNVNEFLDFINKLPLTYDQKLTFIKNYVKKGREQQEQQEAETKANKQRFEIVLQDIKYLMLTPN